MFASHILSAFLKKELNMASVSVPASLRWQFGNNKVVVKEEKKVPVGAFAVAEKMWDHPKGLADLFGIFQRGCSCAMQFIEKETGLGARISEIGSTFGIA